MKYYFFITFSLLLFSCNSEENNENSSSEESSAIPVYNQVYQENYAEDNITDIKNNATNAYVLIDPFQDNIVEYIAEIKSNNNQVGAYISIGT